jgi:hypothetical protein
MRRATLPLETKLKADPYLQWMLHTGRRYLNPSKEPLIVMMVRFGKALERNLMRRLGEGHDIFISPCYEGYRHATVTLSGTTSLLRKQLAVLQELLDAECFKLGTPVGIPTVNPQLPVEVDEPGPDTVVGIVDDGCPFAHSRYRHWPAASDALAVRFVWDQTGPAPTGTPPVAFGYGRFLMSADLQALVANATIAGLVHEDSAYRQSGLPSLRSATSHGAHVMSLVSGFQSGASLPVLGVAPAPSTPPGRKDLAFVQLPDQALDDPSGIWLDNYALDAIQAIRSYARDVFQTKASNVVINLSYGPQTGPHDGTSIFETAMQELIERAEHIDNFNLQIVLPSGNSHLLRTHAEFDLARGGGTVDWCVAPDSPVPSYLEIWLPPGTNLDDLDAALVSPSGEELVVVYELLVLAENDSAGTVAVPACTDSAKTVILMVVGPTARAPEEGSALYALAAPGRWKVRVRVKPNRTARDVAHAYIARGDPNMGRARRGRSGYLDSANYDPMRYRRASVHLVDNNVLDPASVAARGSMSGIATGKRTSVAAGYCASTGFPASYSSGGPSRGPRQGPSWAYPTDQTAALSGVLAGSNRSAAVTRLVGTSFAAPMLARDLWSASLPVGGIVTTPIPLPLPSWMVHRLGGGRRS